MVGKVIVRFIVHSKVEEGGLGIGSLNNHEQTSAFQVHSLGRLFAV